jgi:hypothetical protein
MGRGGRDIREHCSVQHSAEHEGKWAGVSCGGLSNIAAADSVLHLAAICVCQRDAALHVPNILQLGYGTHADLHRGMFASLDVAAPAAERTAAILGLTQLQQLHELGFVPSSHAEIDALASAAEVGLQQLRSLTLLLQPRQHTSCSLASMCIAIARMR